MNLYILRHGLAVEPGLPGASPDAERSLTPKGKARMRDIARGMQAIELSFDLLLTSPYLRARQTADIVAAALHVKDKLHETETLAPDGSMKRLLELLHRESSPENVLLVGHEPYLSELISLLVSGETGFSVTLKKGGLAKLSTSSLRHGRCASLDWLLTPRQLASIRPEQDL